MSNSRRLARVAHAAAARGGILIGQPARKVRNFYGKPLPCCHGPCTNDGDQRYRISVKHERMDGSNVVYIFCGEVCRRAFAKGTRYEQYL